MLPDRPLVVGPLYTPNPELVGHPDGKLPGEPKPRLLEGHLTRRCHPGCVEIFVRRAVHRSVSSRI